MDGEISRFFESDFTPKFLATLNKDGIPNVVLIASFKYFDEKLIFGDFMIWKTKKNLAENKNVCVTALLMDLNYVTIKGEFKGFERTGRYIDRINSIEMYRYNAYMGVRNAGIVEIKEVVQTRKLSKLSVLGNYLTRAHAHNGGDGKPRRIGDIQRGKLPELIMHKFNRLSGIKVLSFVDKDGYPLIIPTASLFALDKDTLILNKRELGDHFEDGKRVACNVVTLEPVSYQVKGTLSSRGRKGIIHIDEVYSAAPPLVGVRIA